MKRGSAPPGTAFVLATAIILTAPLWAGQGYTLSVLVTVAIFGAAGLGAWLIVTTGLWSVGQGLFASLGAYGVAILTVKAHLAFWPSFFLGAIAAMVCAALFAYPFLRASGVTFSILTLVSLLALDQIIDLTPNLTGAGGGLVGVPLPAPIDLPGIEINLSTPTGLYYFAAAILIVCLAVMVRVRSAPIYHTLVAIQERDILAEAVGINVMRYRAKAYVLAGFLTGLIGSFSASYYGVAHPRLWYLFPSIYIVAYVVVGGVRSPYGPVLGAALVVVGTELLRSFGTGAVDNAEAIAVGLGLMIVVLVLPRGLIGLLESLGGRAARARSRSGEVAAAESSPAISAETPTATVSNDTGREVTRSER